MENFLTRTISLLGKDSVDILQNSRVAVFGLGGVGSYCAEALVRCGVGSIDLIDSDTINVTNINRQIIALNSTLGLAKTEVLAGRLKDINPKLNVKIYQTFFSK
ncbi:ThiF family adenylyltransferase, partial [bacterium]|nr:ThiF family adenylyltransferase [bacterium]